MLPFLPRHPQPIYLPPMQRNQLRIIGGQFRSRKLSFPDVEGLRPTGDRIRETLFNWLAPHVEGSYCLDLFAGSGALGLEALSRGAQHVLFIERSTTACDSLRQNLGLLKIQNAEILCANSLVATQFLKTSFDIVFMDPPFDANLILPVCTALETYHLLKSGSLIYLEQSKETPPASLPANWQMYRDKTSGQVRYQLYRRL